MYTMANHFLLTRSNRMNVYYSAVFYNYLANYIYKVQNIFKIKSTRYVEVISITTVLMDGL